MKSFSFGNAVLAQGLAVLLFFKGTLLHAVNKSVSVTGAFRENIQERKNFSSSKRSKNPGYRRGYGFRLQSADWASFYTANKAAGVFKQWPSINDAGGVISGSYAPGKLEGLNHATIFQVQACHSLPWINPALGKQHQRSAVIPTVWQASGHWRYFAEDWRVAVNGAFAADWNDHMNQTSSRRWPMSWLRFGLGTHYRKDVRGFFDGQLGWGLGRKISFDPSETVHSNLFTQSDFKEIKDNNFSEWLKPNAQMNAVCVAAASGFRFGGELWLFSLLRIKKWALENLAFFSTVNFQGTGQTNSDLSQTTPYCPRLSNHQKLLFKKAENIRLSGFGVEKGLRWKFSPILGMELGINSLYSELENESNFIKWAFYKLFLGLTQLKVSFNYRSDLAKKELLAASPKLVRELRSGAASRVDLCEDMGLSDRFLAIAKVKFEEQKAASVTEKNDASNLKQSKGSGLQAENNDQGGQQGARTDSDADHEDFDKESNSKGQDPVIIASEQARVEGGNFDHLEESVLQSETESQQETPLDTAASANQSVAEDHEEGALESEKAAGLGEESPKARFTMESNPSVREDHSEVAAQTEGAELQPEAESQQATPLDTTVSAVLSVAEDHEGDTPAAEEASSLAGVKITITPPADQSVADNQEKSVGEFESVYAESDEEAEMCSAVETENGQDTEIYLPAAANQCMKGDHQEDASQYKRTALQSEAKGGVTPVKQPGAEGNEEEVSPSVQLASRENSESKRDTEIGSPAAADQSVTRDPEEDASVSEAPFLQRDSEIEQTGEASSVLRKTGQISTQSTAEEHISVISDPKSSFTRID